MIVLTNHIQYKTITIHQVDMNVLINVIQINMNFTVGIFLIIIAKVVILLVLLVLVIISVRNV